VCLCVCVELNIFAIVCVRCAFQLEEIDILISSCAFLQKITARGSRSLLRVSACVCVCVCVCLWKFHHHHHHHSRWQHCCTHISSSVRQALLPSTISWLSLPAQLSISSSMYFIYWLLFFFYCCGKTKCEKQIANGRQISNWPSNKCFKLQLLLRYKPKKRRKFKSMGFFQKYVKCKVVLDALYVCMYTLSVWMCITGAK